MPRTTIEVHPEILSWARERSGYDVQTASEKLRLNPTPGKLLALESGEVSPTPSELRRAAHLYRVSPAVFFLAEVPSQGFDPPSDFRSLPESEQGKFSPELRAEIDRVRAQIRFMKELAALGIVNPVFEPLRLSGDDPVEDLAARIRLWLDIDSGYLAEAKRDSKPILSAWVRAVEHDGILVSQVSGVPVNQMRGFCIPDNAFPIIVLNGADADTARLFTLLHELIHVLNGDECVCSGTLADGTVETFCNAVAAAVLMPRAHLMEIEKVRAATPSTKWTLGDLGLVAAPFGVSREAVLRRLLTLRKISQDRYQVLRLELLRSYAVQKRSQAGSRFSTSATFTRVSSYVTSRCPASTCCTKALDLPMRFAKRSSES